MVCVLRFYIFLRQPREHNHESNVRLRRRSQVQIQPADVQHIHRALQSAAPVSRHSVQGDRHARRPVLQGRCRSGRHTKDRAQSPAARGGPHVRPDVVRSAVHERPLAEQARRGHAVRAGRDARLPGQERPRVRGAQSRGQERRLRGHARRQVHHGVLGAQLLRHHGQQGRAHKHQGQRRHAQVRDLRGRRASQDQAHGLCQSDVSVRSGLKRCTRVSLIYEMGS
jgi:hypothetical protein